MLKARVSAARGKGLFCHGNVHSWQWFSIGSSNRSCLKTSRKKLKCDCQLGGQSNKEKEKKKKEKQERECQKRGTKRKVLKYLQVFIPTLSLYLSFPLYILLYLIFSLSLLLYILSTLFVPFSIHPFFLHVNCPFLLSHCFILSSSPFLFRNSSRWQLNSSPRHFLQKKREKITHGEEFRGEKKRKTANWRRGIAQVLFITQSVGFKRSHLWGATRKFEQAHDRQRKKKKKKKEMKGE